MSDEQGYVEFQPDAEKQPYLQQAGTYGPGQPEPFEAECVVVGYEFPAAEAPRYIKGAEAKDYAFLLVKVNSVSFGTNFVRHWEPIGTNSGSRLPSWLRSLGVAVGDPPGYGHRPGEVVGAKCSVKVSEPRKSDDRWFNGRIQDILGV